MQDCHLLQRRSIDPGCFPSSAHHHLPDGSNVTTGKWNAQHINNWQFRWIISCLKSIVHLNQCVSPPPCPAWSSSHRTSPFTSTHQLEALAPFCNNKHVSKLNGHLSRALSTQLLPSQCNWTSFPSKPLWHLINIEFCSSTLFICFVLPALRSVVPLGDTFSILNHLCEKLSYAHWLIVLLCISPASDTCTYSLWCYIIWSPPQEKKKTNGGGTEGHNRIPTVSNDWKVDCDLALTQIPRLEGKLAGEKVKTGGSRNTMHSLCASDQLIDP